jgi:hypothetical protein
MIHSNGRRRTIPVLLLLSLIMGNRAEGPAGGGGASGDTPRPLPSLTVIAIGDVGEAGGALRSNASLLNDMYTEAHDGGIFQCLILLGDNFYPTGLNLPVDDVNGKVKSILGPFRTTLSGLGRSHVHAIPGNHDWYARNALEESLLLGLVNISTAPIGLTERGNVRAAALEQWSYHFRMPADALYPVGGESRDTVQFLFFDSPLLLRTDSSTWHTALDSLQILLRTTRNRPGIGWRVLCVHNPFHSVGEHGGYSVWDDEARTVTYLSNCDKDSNALGFLKNWLDPQDLCSAKYQQYVDSLKATIRAAGVNVQVALSGHDHSLQLLYYPGREGESDGWPKVQIVSGAGSQPTRVKFPAPPHEYTSAQTRPEKEGLSLSGFAQLRFEESKLRVVFYQGSSGNPIDMGGGRTEFWIDRSGRLLDAQKHASH